MAEGPSRYNFGQRYEFTEPKGVTKKC